MEFVQAAFAVMQNTPRHVYQVLTKRAERLAALEAHIKENHSYETPEIIATEIPWGSREYLTWISEETRTDAS